MTTKIPKETIAKLDIIANDIESKVVEMDGAEV